MVEETQSGWFNVSDVTVSVGTVTSGFDVDDVDFVNTAYGSIEGTKFATDGTDQAGPSTCSTAIRGQPQMSRRPMTAPPPTAMVTTSFTNLAPGTYWVVEETQSGWFNVSDVTVSVGTVTSGFDVDDVDFVNTAYGSIEGTKFEDADGDGTTTGDQTGEAGWTIYLFDSDPGPTPDVTQADDSTTTDSNGDYSFTNLAPGTYWVVEETQSGWFNVSDVTVSVGTVTSGFDVDDVDFVNTAYGSIEGTKFEDADGDGTTTGDQTGEAGWTIYLFDSDPGPTPDVTQADDSTTTDSNGDYSFTNLAPGTYWVVEETQSGWFNVSDVTVSVGTVTSGFDVDDVDFVNTAYGSIEGTKFEDADGDGTTTGDQTGEAGWTIYLFDSDPGPTPDVTQADDSTTTDSNGDYSFTNLAPGTYWVVEEDRNGWTAISAVTVSVGTVTSGFDVDDVDFVNFEDFDITGYKWGDVNGNGAWDEGAGAGLSEWTIVIDTNLNPDDGYLLFDLTDGDGKYEFLGLNPDTSVTDLGLGGSLGDYAGETLYVYEIQQDGFTQTYDGTFSFVIASGVDYNATLGVAELGNFGNQMMEGANRTPGFWQSTLGQSLYDGDDTNNGDANGDGIPDGDKNFEEEGWSETDLLIQYGHDLVGGDGINDHFAIWDEGTIGVEDPGDIFLTPEELHSWVSGGGKGGGRDFTQVLERDLGAAFLNSINNDAISGGTGPGYTVDPEIADSYEDAVDWILKWDSDFDGSANGSKKDQKIDWNDYGSDAHTELGAYNEMGGALIEGAITQVKMDGDDYSSTQVQEYLALQESLNIQTEFLGSYISDGEKSLEDAMLAQTGTIV